MTSIAGSMRLTGATAARALVVYLQRGAFQTDDVQISAVALQVRPYFLVQQFIDLIELELVGFRQLRPALALRKPGGGLGIFP